MARAKEANNGKTTLALVIAGLQNISNQPKRSEMTVCREWPPGTDDGRSRKRGAENVRKRETDSRNDNKGNP